MAGFWSSICFLVRFLAAMCLVAVLSPLPDNPGNRTDTFRSLLSSMDGMPSLVIRKSRHSLTLYKGSSPVKTYHAVFGRGYADGDKEQTGDRRTPEGDFYICSMNHSERFYKFMGLSYPSRRHAEQGLRKGFITAREFSMIERALAERRQPSWDTRLGGAIGIHGRIYQDPAAQDRGKNWTDGCIALANTDVDELFGIVQIGTPVSILP